MGAGLNGIIFDDLEWPLTRVSRSLYTYKSNILQMVREFSIVQSTVLDHYRGSIETVQKKLGVVAEIFLLKAVEGVLYQW